LRLRNGQGFYIKEVENSLFGQRTGYSLQVLVHSACEALA